MCKVLRITGSGPESTGSEAGGRDSRGCLRHMRFRFACATGQGLRLGLGLGIRLDRHAVCDYGETKEAFLDGAKV